MLIKISSKLEEVLQEIEQTNGVQILDKRDKNNCIEYAELDRLIQKLPEKLQNQLISCINFDDMKMAVTNRLELGVGSI
jgi:hypothetical protein